MALCRNSTNAFLASGWRGCCQNGSDGRSLRATTQMSHYDTPSLLFLLNLRRQTVKYVCPYYTTYFITN